MSGAIHPGLCPEPRSIGGDGAAPTRVLFVCTHNSARSQMAEAILRHYGGAGIEVRSAGSHPTHVHPLALRTLADLGVDASGLESKYVDAFANDRFDHVITLCDRVRELCPSRPEGPEQIHWSLADPSTADSSEEAALLAFRGTATELTRRVRYLLPVLTAARGEDAA